MDEINARALEVVNSLGPPKSIKMYEKAYSEFTKWKADNRVHDGATSENMLLVYFKFRRDEKKVHASTLWPSYSALKHQLHIKEGVDITNFNKLRILLKDSSKGMVQKKALTFERSDLVRFLEEAPDEQYFVHKVR